MLCAWIFNNTIGDMYVVCLDIKKILKGIFTNPMLAFADVSYFKYSITSR